MVTDEVVRGGWGWRLLVRMDAISNRIYGSRYNPLYQSGAIVVVLLGVLLATGIYLLLFYRIGSPWASVSRITDQVWTGRWIRGLHRFSSDAVIIATAVHAFRMYAQRRSWGARTLAWLSGLVLLGAIFICGWTGYVLVWDLQAQLLAVEGARFLDVLPIFSEPIGRAFVGEEPVPSAFFFLNLFAHIALPIGLGLLVWIHVSRVARPRLLPPRGLSIGVVASLMILAVVWPIGMAPPADLFRLPSSVPLDFFFGFWLPLTRHLPAWSVWVLGGGLITTVALIPVWTRPAPAERPAKSQVNERQCTGCEQCALDCPFDAITMVPRTDGRETLVASVNPRHCVSCGICIGSCAPMAIGPPGRTGRDQLAGARRFFAEAEPSGFDIVVLGCEWSAASSVSRTRAGEAGVSFFPVQCAGNVHTSVVEYLVREGAGGVVVVSCPERDCRSREGGKWLDQRLYHQREAELKERVDRRRVRRIEAGAGEPEVLRSALQEFRREVAELVLESFGSQAVGEPSSSNGLGEAGSECEEEFTDLVWSLRGEESS